MSAYEISLLSVIGLNVMLAVSLNMISGFCGQISLGHGAFYGAGAYAAALIMIATRNVPLSLISAAAVAALLGVVVGFASLRVRSDFLAVTTIGVNFLFTGFVRKQGWLGGEMGISGIPASGLGAAGNMIMILLFACATIALSLYINQSWMGFVFRAVSEDEDTAATLGINAGAYKLAAFGIGTAVAGLAGGLYAFFTQFITADTFDFIFSVLLMAMVVIGGIGIDLRRCRGRGGADAAAGSDPLRQRLPLVGLRRLVGPGYLPRARRHCRTDAAIDGAGEAMIAALQLEDLAVHFGGVNAVDGVTISIAPGELVGLIGPNGAGKTTLIRIVAGAVKPDRGRVVLAGSDVTRNSTATRVRKGLALTHQMVRPFREMTVLDNVVLAAGYRRTANPLRAALNVSRSRERERAADILIRVGLSGTEGKLSGSLPLGQMKRLEMARALAVDPQIVLFDEPLAGLNQTEASRQIETIVAVNAQGITVVLVEHNLEEVMRSCRRLIVLNDGRVIGDGVPQEVMGDAVVREAYVGSGSAGRARH